MYRKWKSRSRLLAGALMLAGWSLAFSGAASAPQFSTAARAATAGPAIPVVEGRAESRNVPIWLTGIGSVQPLNAVTVKVRVDGQLDSVAFTEGQDVHTGDLLAKIDPRPFQAQLKQAQANKAKDEAQLANARLDLVRFSSLEAKGFAPKQNLDTQRAQVATLEASVQADQAAVDMAQLQVDFTAIKSPIEGRAGLRLVDPGSIVHATDAGGLVMITQMQPIAALFTLSQDDLPAILAAMAESAPSVAAYSRDSNRLLASGKLVFVDSQVDQATGQVRVKAMFENADRVLWPGEFITARVRVRTIKDATVIPSKAIQRAESGTFVFRIADDDTVEVRPVTATLVSDSVAIVASGLAPGDRIVVDGQYRLQPGSRVEARPAAGATP
jgi:multidrug efflux system membrane fusion protein